MLCTGHFFLAIIGESKAIPGGKDNRPRAMLCTSHPFEVLFAEEYYLIMALLLLCCNNVREKEIDFCILFSGSGRLLSRSLSILREKEARRDRISFLLLLRRGTEGEG